MLGLLSALVGTIVTVLLAAGAVAARALTRAGGAVAAAFGVAIVVLAGFPFLALLILFLVASVLATRYRFAEKSRRHVQEGVHGERGVSNVVAHIVVPTSLAVAGGLPHPILPSLDLAVLYTAALAFGASDTFASEFGVLAGRARSLLTFRPVEPGTNGGVSGLGEAAAFLGALTTAAVGLGLFALFDFPIAAPLLLVGAAAAAGFLACQVDSVLGELLENRGYLTKGGTNFLGMLAAVGIAASILAVAGVAW